MVAVNLATESRDVLARTAVTTGIPTMRHPAQAPAIRARPAGTEPTTPGYPDTHGGLVPHLDEVAEELHLQPG